MHHQGWQSPDHHHNPSMPQANLLNAMISRPLKIIVLLDGGGNKPSRMDGKTQAFLQRL